MSGGSQTSIKFSPKKLDRSESEEFEQKVKTVYKISPPNRQVFSPVSQHAPAKLNAEELLSELDEEAAKKE